MATIDFQQNDVNVGGTTASTSTTSGALIVAGGAGIALNIFGGGTLNNTGATNLSTASGITTVGSSTALTVSAAGALNVNNTTASTSTATGALLVAGGAGFTGDTYANIVSARPTNAEVDLGDNGVVPTSNDELNDPDDGLLLKLVRAGTSDESFDARAFFALSRYEDPGGDEARAQLHIRLNHGATNSVTLDQFKFRSNGDFLMTGDLNGQQEIVAGLSYETIARLSDDTALATSNGAVNDPTNGRTIQLLRSGTPSESDASICNMNIDRYENDGLLARSRLSFLLRHNSETDESTYANVMDIKSNAEITFRNSATSSMHLVGTDGLTLTGAETDTTWNDTNLSFAGTKAATMRVTVNEEDLLFSYVTMDMLNKSAAGNNWVISQSSIGDAVGVTFGINSSSGEMVYSTTTLVTSRDIYWEVISNVS